MKNLIAACLVTFALGIGVGTIIRAVTKSASDAVVPVSSESPRPRTSTTRAVAYWDGSIVSGEFRNEAFSASVTADPRLSFKTFGTWMGTIVPERWSDYHQKWLPDWDVAVYAPTIEREGHPSALCNVMFNDPDRPGKWRLNMRYHTSGECRYQLTGRVIKD